MRTLLLLALLTLSFNTIAQKELFVWGVKGDVKINKQKVDSSKHINRAETIELSNNSYLSFIHSSGQFTELTGPKKLQREDIEDIYNDFIKNRSGLPSPWKYLDYEFPTVSVSRGCRCLSNPNIEVEPLASFENKSTIAEDGTITLLIKLKPGSKERVKTIEILDMENVLFLQRIVSVEPGTTTPIKLDLSELDLVQYYEPHYFIQIRYESDENEGEETGVFTIYDSKETKHEDQHIKNTIDDRLIASKMFLALYYLNNNRTFEAYETLMKSPLAGQIVGYRHIYNYMFKGL